MRVRHVQKKVSYVFIQKYIVQIISKSLYCNTVQLSFEQHLFETQTIIIIHIIERSVN